MKTLTDHLSSYAAYHRDRRNIATHFVGIPMIVLATTALLARPAVLVGGLAVSPALVVAVGAIAFYLALDVAYGAIMAAVLGLAVWGGAAIAALSTGAWLGAGLGLFIVGWVFQLIGHVFEGRKPAFVDDLLGLLIGPLFLVAELGFALGYRSALGEAIAGRVGPVRGR